jgi:hypothetical protein
MIRGPLVGVLVSIAPDVYGPFVTTNKSGQQVLIVECLNAVYGMMVATLLYYKKFAKSLLKEGFKLNPYDGCVANKIVDGKQVTICFHANECKISHVCTKVVDEAIEWLGLNMRASLSMVQEKCRSIGASTISIWEWAWTIHTRVSVVLQCMTIWVGS